MSEMKGWKPDARVGWRWVNPFLCYFDGNSSACGRWGQPQVFGRPRKPVKADADLTANDRKYLCPKCAQARFGVTPLETDFV